LTIDSISVSVRTLGDARFLRHVFIKSTFHSARYFLLDEDFSCFVDLESAIQQEVSEHVSKELLNSRREQILTIFSMGKPDRQIANVDQVLVKRDERIASLNQALASLSSETSRLNHVLSCM
jgi:hypothetical protein